MNNGTFAPMFKILTLIILLFERVRGNARIMTGASERTHFLKKGDSNCGYQLYIKALIRITELGYKD